MKVIDTMKLSLALIALAFSANSVQADSSSGKMSSSSCGKMNGGKMSSSSTDSSCSSYPTCHAPSGGKMYGGKMYGGKMYSTSSADTRFLRQIVGSSSGKMGSGGKMSSGGGSGTCCGAPQDSCTKPDEDKIPCDKIWDEPVTLKTSLRCMDGETPDTMAAITMSGPDAVLDCAGNGDNLILGDTHTSSEKIGVRLLNGASMINCHISGFNKNVVMGVDCTMCAASSSRYLLPGQKCSDVCDSDTSITVSNSKILGGEKGIFTQGTGCFSVDCTIVSGAGTGIEVTHTGDFIMANTDVLMSIDRGVFLFPSVEVYAAFIDSNVFLSRDVDAPLVGQSPGFLFGIEGAMFGKIVAEFFGVVKSSGNQGQGLFADGPSLSGMSPEVKVDGEFEIEYSAFGEGTGTLAWPSTGYLQRAGTTEIGEDGLLFSCNYLGKPDILEDPAPGVSAMSVSITDESPTSLNTCDSEMSDLSGCKAMSCPGTTMAEGCVGSASGSGKMYGGKMYGGKMYGGKMYSSRRV